jgi:hypothetical protein
MLLSAFVPTDRIGDADEDMDRDGFFAIIQVLDDRRQGPREGEIQRVVVSRIICPEVIWIP